MNTVEMLQAARRLIEKPENWTKGFLARDQHGVRCDIDSPEADKFCLVGSVRRAVTSWKAAGPYAYIAACIPSGYFDVADFNDNASHEQVLSVLDKAIGVAKQDACDTNSERPT